MIYFFLYNQLLLYSSPFFSIYNTKKSSCDGKRCIYLRTEDYIADNIIALCKKRDMSKYRLSQLTGISQSSIGKIIAKESLPTMPTVEKICDALGVTMAQFFAGMDVPVSLSESQQEVLSAIKNILRINDWHLSSKHNYDADNPNDY